MNDEQDKDAQADVTASLQDFSQMFAPSWARQDPEAATQQQAARFVRDDDDDDRRGPRGPRGDRPPRRDGFRPDRPRREAGLYGDRPPRREGDDRRGPRGDRPPRRDDDRRGPRGDHTFPRRPEPPRLPPIDLDVRFMPEPKALNAIVRRIQTNHLAYPFRDIVKLFQADDASMTVRLDAKAKDGAPPAPLFQCRLCGMPALTEAEVVDHLFKKHLGDYFDIEEVEGEPPSGNFTVIARCGLSGELLGPPNLHSFSIKVQEMVRDRYPQMGEAEYRRHIEMVRDPEVIEQWKEQSRKRTVYRRKPEEKKAEAPATPPPAETPEAASQPEGPEAEAPSAAESPALERHEAEAIFRREILPAQVGSATHLVFPATALQNLPDRRLASFLSGRFADEQNPYRRPLPQGDEAAPYRRGGTLFTAIHAAFHHRGLHFFRANDEHGQEFVMAAAPVEFDVAHATADLRAIVNFVTENPSCSMKQLMEGLDLGGDADKAKKATTDVKWLVEKGYLVGYFNGNLALPSSHPAFFPAGAKQKKAKKNAAPAEATGEQPAEATAEKPAAEAALPQPQDSVNVADAPAEKTAEEASGGLGEAALPQPQDSENAAEAPAEKPAEEASGGLGEAALPQPQDSVNAADAPAEKPAGEAAPPQSQDNAPTVNELAN